MAKVLGKVAHIFDPVDMTKGKVSRCFILFSIPIMLTALFQQIYILVDAMIVGQTLDSDAVAGINNSLVGLTLITFFGSGLASAFSSVTGKRNGHKDYKGVRKALTNHFYLVIIVSIILSTVGYFSIEPLLHILGISKEAAPAMYENATNYMFMLAGGIVALILFSTAVGELQGLGNAFAAFLFYVISTLLNIGLDYLFILAFNWGVRGAAAATVLAQFLVAIAAYAYIFIRYPHLRPTRKDWGFDGVITGSSLKIGLPLAFSLSLSAVGMIIMQSAVVSFDFTASGDPAYASGGLNYYPAQIGYGVAQKVVNFLCVPLSAIGQTSLFFQSQNRGARDYERIKKGFRFSLIYGLIAYALILLVGMLLSINGAYQYLFLSDDKIFRETIEYGNAYMYTAIPFSVFLMLLYVSRNSLLGWEKPIFATIAGLMELVTRILVSLFLPLAFTGGVATSSESGIYAFGAVCMADPFCWVLSLFMLALCLYYLRHTDKLKRKRTPKELERKAREAAEKAAALEMERQKESEAGDILPESEGQMVPEEEQQSPGTIDTGGELDK